MAGERIKITLRRGEDGSYAPHYECEGFEGASCNTVAEIMTGLGNVTDKKTTDDGYVHEIPVPVPNQTNG